MNKESYTLNRSFAALRQFARQRVDPDEQCEMCSTKLVSEHQHLIELESGLLVCSCDACALLFSNQSNPKYRRIPRDVRSLPNLHLTDAQREELFSPIDLAFFCFSSPAQRLVASYPGPAGAIESPLQFETWNHIVVANPVLQMLEPDVEALLVNRLRQADGTSAENYYVAPIDKCYHLVGLIRANWDGISGGSKVWQEIRSFFDAINAKAKSSF